MKNKQIHALNLLNNKFNNMKMILFLQLALILFLSGNSYSTIYIQRTLEEDIVRSDLIISGTLIDKYTERRIGGYTYLNEKGERQSGESEKLYTIYKFEINEVLKGSHEGHQVEVLMLGGCVKSDCYYVSGSYSYNLNEKGLLFLRSRSADPSTYYSPSPYRRYQMESDGSLVVKDEEFRVNVNDTNIKNSKQEFSSKPGNVSINKTGQAKLNFVEKLNLKSLRKMIIKELGNEK